MNDWKKTDWKKVKTDWKKVQRKLADLFDRMQKAVADEARVAEFVIDVGEKGCRVYIRTTWGPEINAYQPRKDTWRAVREALDELDQIKPPVIPATLDKE